MMDPSERRRILADMHYIRRLIDETLLQVLTALDAHWSQIPAAAQETILRLRAELADQLRDAVTSFDRGIKINAFLKDLEAIDAVLEFAYDAIHAGKTSEIFRNAGGPGQEATDRIISLLQRPPAQGERKLTESGAGLESMLGNALGISKDAVIAAQQATAEYFTKVDFPAEIPDDTTQEHALVVQLVLNEPVETQVEGQVEIVFADPQAPEYVEVHVTAPGFAERTGVWTRTLAVSQGNDSQPAIFLLKLQETGSKAQRITVDFYHRGRNVGSFVFETQVTSAGFTRTGGPTAERPATGNTTIENSVVRGTATVVRALDGVRLSAGTSPVDVELRITRDGKALHFMLHSARAYVGYHWRSMGKIELDGLDDPASYFEQRTERLSELANKPINGLSETEAEDYQIELAVLGYDLYQQLFPETLRQEYWKLLALRDKIQQKENRQMSLLITSDEPWVPWELIKPFEEDKPESDFLAGAFQLSRWLAGRGPMQALSVHSAQLVAPDLDLDFVKDEKIYFASLSQAGIQVPPPIVAQSDFIKMARRGGVQLIHVATHGNFNSQDVNSSPIKLQDKDLIPSDLSRMSERGLVKDRPLVFFNTCHSGRLGFDLTKPGGWAQRMVDQFGVAAFVGSHWAINDQLAAIFSRTFYDELRGQKTLGEAFHSARIAIRDKQPANPTWLAYTLYGDPNSRIELGSQGQ
ncbi:CHAT domain-containing protein [bacterium]|nr:CHAT domain-containing protein [bacterium]